MIAPLKIASSHEEVFTDRYQRLLAWSMQLTGNERDLAEDLLHDAFVQFTFAQPDLGSIKNLDGYFYSMLRNLHLSHVRRETRNRWQQLSVVEYDSAEDGLRTTDLRDQLHVQDELRKVCHYVCVRKETARAASVLILRFFHGYYPSEIVQFLRTTREAVDVQLLIARREARLSFENLAALAFMDAKQLPEVFPSAMARGTDEFLDELCLTIYQSNRGGCLSHKQLKEIYSAANQSPIEVAQLAHLVSCPSCLDEVNRMLGLPLLSERNPTETLGRDNRPKGPGGGGPKGTGSAGIGSWRRRARRVFEHKPQALSVAVNGYVQASQPVSSELSELNLNVDLSEDISFVEVFSEQKLRLLLLNVDDLPPAGPGEREQLLEMSDGRTLSLKLEFRSPWPALHVAYHDPTFKEVQELLDESSSEDPALPVVVPKPAIREQVFTSRFFDHRDFAARLRDLFGADFWLRPSTITAMVALVLMASLLLTRLHVGTPAPVAAELLRQAADAEQALAARTDTVLHRTITVEEYKVAQTSVCDGCPGDLIARHKVDIWHSAEKGITARRVFDDQNNLVAGDWRRADGVQTIYHHGARPQLQLTPKDHNGSSSLTFDNVWQTDLAAKDFTGLIGNAQNAHVQETANTYIISCDSTGSVSTGSGSDRVESSSRRDDVKVAQGFSPGIGSINKGEPRRGDRDSNISAESAKSADSSATSAVKTQPATLLKATLTLSKADLHAIEQTLTLQQDNDVREFRMMETSFERRPPSTVAPAVFEPEPELTSSVEPGTRNSKPETGAVNALTPTPAAATTELEVEVLRLINQSGADLGDQVSVRRTPEGQLLVQGIVETDQRKSEVLRALAPIAANPTVKLRVETVAEVLRRQKLGRQGGQTGEETVERLESGGSKIPADAELRRYFAAKGLSGAQLDQAVNQYAARMVERSLQALRHAGAMDRLAQRFSLEQLRTLDPEARSKWLGLLRSHAQALERELSSLRHDLGPFIASGSGPQEGFNIDTDAELQQAVHRLFELCSATDQAVRSAFTISESTSGASAIKSPQFFRSLEQAEQLSKSIQRSATDTHR